MRACVCPSIELLQIFRMHEQCARNVLFFDENTPGIIIKSIRNVVPFGLVFPIFFAGFAAGNACPLIRSSIVRSSPVSSSRIYRLLAIHELCSANITTAPSRSHNKRLCSYNTSTDTLPSKDTKCVREKAAAISPYASARSFSSLALGWQCEIFDFFSHEMKNRFHARIGCLCWLFVFFGLHTPLFLGSCSHSCRLSVDFCF